MKKIIKYIIFIILLLINLSAFAESKINISLSEQNITLDKTFVVTVNIETTYTGSVEIVNIAGIDSFNRVGQENSSELSNFNGDIIKKLKLKISLKSNSTGNFVIGPALLKVGEKELKSNIVSINITKNTINQSIEEENTKNKKEQKEDIKTINKKYDFLSSYMFYQLLIISLLLGLLLYNTLIVKKKQEKKAIKKTEKKIIKKSKNSIIKKLEKLSKSDEKINKSEFYEQLNKTFREYFDFLGYKDTDLLTLKEIKLLDIDKKLISLFEKSYLNEFNDKKDTQTLRKKIISDLVKIIK